MSNPKEPEVTKAPVYIHVGCPKTATTWLQVRIFPVHQDIAYENGSGVFGGIPRHKQPENEIREKVEELRSKTDLPVLFSFEGLTGMCLPTRKEGNTRRTPQEMAEMLKRIVPDARILLTIREQGDMVESTYLQYIFGGYALTPKKALADTEWVRSFLDYNEIVRTYETLFGDENVWVGTYEQLKSNPQDFLDALFAYMGVSKMELDASILSARDNVGTSPFMLRFIRMFNICWPNRLQMNPRWHSFSLRTFKRIDKVLGGRKSDSRWQTDGAIDLTAYEEGNRELDRRRHLGLEKYGYRL